MTRDKAIALIGIVAILGLAYIIYNDYDGGAA